MGCHNWYPSVIQNNSNVEFKVPANEHASATSCGENLEKCKWSNDMFVDMSIDYIRRRAREANPFFLYFSSTTPHEGFLAGPKDHYPVPAPYRNHYDNESSWTVEERHYAAAVWAQDVFVGRVLDELDALGISENTVVFFSGDNGPAGPDFNDGSGPFRGCKASLHEGGVRQQVLARWPKHIEAGSTSDHWFTFWDFLPTAAELANATLSANTKVDGTSAVSSLKGKTQQNLTPVYYEFCWYGYGSEAQQLASDSSSPESKHKCDLQSWGYGPGWAQSYRKDNWKAIRVHEDTDNMLLYDLAQDVGETRNVAKQHPEVVQEISKLMDASHADSSAWPKGTKSKTCCGNCFTKGGCGRSCPGHSSQHTTLSTLVV